MRPNPGWAMAVALLFFSSPSSAAETDCASCHAQPPVPEQHVPVAQTSAEDCMMCHASSGQDRLFVQLHNHHLDIGMGCDSCHDKDPGAERLKNLLGAEILP